jgi:uncharacterized protein YceK
MPLPVIIRLLVVFLPFVHLTGCAAIVTVADAAVTVAATTVKVTTKAAGAVADAVIPDAEEKKSAPSK